MLVRVAEGDASNSFLKAGPTKCIVGRRQVIYELDKKQSTGWHKVPLERGGNKLVPEQYLSSST